MAVVTSGASDVSGRGPWGPCGFWASPHPTPGAPSAAVATHVGVAGSREGHLQVVEAGGTEGIEPMHHLLGGAGKGGEGVGRGGARPPLLRTTPAPELRLPGRVKGGLYRPLRPPPSCAHAGMRALGVSGKRAGTGSLR